jgi:porin
MVEAQNDQVSAFMPRVLAAVAALALALALAAHAGADEEVEAYAGTLGTRAALSGDWNGHRTQLAERGVTFDLSLTQIEQGAVRGGKETGWAYGGRGDLVVGVDTEKLGWWRGGRLTLEFEGNYGSDVNDRTGALNSVNSSQGYPAAHANGVPELMLTQLVSRKVGVVVGKVQTGSDTNEFAAGKGDTQFFNLALQFNAAATVTIPYSALGVGLFVLPTGDEAFAKLKVFVVDSNGKGDSPGFDTVFNGETTYHAEGRVRTLISGLTGHQLIGGAYSTKSFTALEQNVRVVIEDRSLQKKQGSWVAYYNFDQYLYEPERGSGRGLGVFGRFGVSDGNPNPTKYLYSAGIGGKGVVPGRPLDGFGVGYYYVAVGHPTFTGPFATATFLRDEQGAEVYYDVAITPWARLAPDLQVVSPAQKRTVGTGQAGAVASGVRPVETATMVGIRLKLII